VEQHFHSHYMPSRHVEGQFYYFYNQHLHTPDNDNKSLHLPAIPVEKMYIFSGIIINLKTISQIHYQMFSQLLHSSKYHSTVMSTWKLPNRRGKNYDTPQKIRSVKLINCKSIFVIDIHNLNILLWI
jgi:hypothetical protein